MGWLHAGTGGRDFRSPWQKRRDESDERLAFAEKTLARAQEALVRAEKFMAETTRREKQVKILLDQDGLTKKEVEAIANRLQKEAEMFIDETNPEWPTPELVENWASKDGAKENIFSQTRIVNWVCEMRGVKI